MRVVASLLQATATRTAQGGQVVSYESLGTLWLRLGARRRREKADADVARAIETLAAVIRADERLAEGLVVRLGGADWDLVGLKPEGPGKVKLNLERRR